MSKLCEKCREPGARFVCGWCRRARYCSRACQIAAAPSHSPTCESPPPPPTPPPTPRLIRKVARMPRLPPGASPVLAVGLRIIEKATPSCSADPEARGANRKRKMAVPNMIIKPYGDAEVLGEGARGKVVLQRGDDGSTIAVKLVRVDNEDANAPILPVEACREMSLRNLNHPNVVSICNVGYVYRDRGQGFARNEQPKFFAVAMNAGERDLGNFIAWRTWVRDHKRRKLAGPCHPAVAKGIAYQLARALDYCHSQLVVNFDVKPSNFVLEVDEVENPTTRESEPGVPKALLIDAGLSRSNVVNAVKEGIHYSIWWRPPECLFDDADDPVDGSFGGDVWALACVFYELAKGEPLFQADDEQGMMSGIVDLLGPPPPELCASWLKRWPRVANQQTGNFNKRIRPLNGRHPGLPNLLRQMLRYHPCERLTMREVLNSQYFVQVATQIERSIPAPEPYRAAVFSRGMKNVLVDCDYALEVMLQIENKRWVPPAGDIGTEDSRRVLTLANRALMEIWYAHELFLPTALAMHIAREAFQATSGAIFAAGTENAVACVAARIAYSCKACAELVSDDACATHGWMHTAEQLSRLERAIALAVDFDFHTPTAGDFYNQYCRRHELTAEQTRQGELLLMNACAYAGNVGAVRPSHLAESVALLVKTGELSDGSAHKQTADVVLAVFRAKADDSCTMRLMQKASVDWRKFT